jgi:RNA polymerase sigma-70 factor (ECF subfamily)
MVASVAIAGLPFTSFAIGGEPSLAEPLSAEAAWTRAATRGDKQAFGRLVDLHKRAVFGLCLRLLRDPEDARDAAQEAFARAYGALGSYDRAQPFTPWLFRIARNHCLDVLRRRIPDAQRLELDADPGGDAPPQELADPAAARGDETIERRELAGALERAVGALPPNYREVVHLFHVEHLSYKEIAATLDVPIGTVMTWLHRARARLKDALTAGGTEVAP